MRSRTIGSWSLRRGVRLARTIQFNAICALLLMLVLALAGCGEPSPTPTATPIPAALQPQPASAAQTAPSSPVTLTPATTSVTTEISAVATASLTTTLTLTATATRCPAPAGWALYTVAAGDTLSALAVVSGASVAELMQANCLLDDGVIAGSQLWLPFLPAPTATPTPEPTRCGAPTGWVVYVVQPGDTLSGLAATAGVTVDAIRLANCLPDETIYAGRGLHLPTLPRRAPDTGVGLPAGSDVQPPLAAPACAPFACAAPASPESRIDFGSGSPGEAGLCADNAVLSAAADGIFIDMGAPIAVGGMLLFGACTTSITETVAFSLMRPDGQTLDLAAKAVQSDAGTILAAELPLSCNMVGGPYAITLTTGQSAEPVTREFTLVPSDFPIALAQTITARTYRVHFCSYSDRQGESIPLTLYGGELGDNNACIGAKSWGGEAFNVTANGWGSFDLILPLPNDDSDCYFLCAEDDICALIPHRSSD